MIFFFSRTAGPSPSPNQNPQRCTPWHFSKNFRHMLIGRFAIIIISFLSIFPFAYLMHVEIIFFADQIDLIITTTCTPAVIP